MNLSGLDQLDFNVLVVSAFRRHQARHTPDNYLTAAQRFFVTFFPFGKNIVGAAASLA
jgi:hypothetical protein